MKFKCKRCGNCCITKPVNICYSDIMRWKEEDRKDILKKVTWIQNYPREKVGGFYIKDTAIVDIRKCPFMKSFDWKEEKVCTIYKTRPLACKDFPMGSKKIDDCPGFVVPSLPIFEAIKTKQHEDFFNAFEERGKLKIIVLEAHLG